MNAPARLREAVAAAAILAIGMGFGRFAFTAIYPHMLGEGVLTLRAGSLAASANYAGYLLALPMPVWLFVTVRGVAGVFSALAMVAASLWLLVQRRQARGAPLLYAGVGAGIAVSAELLVLASHLGWRSAGMWLLLAGVTVLLGLAAAPAIAAGGQATPDAPPPAAAPALAPVAPWPLVLIYGLAGLGYIVTATYLPVLAGSLQAQSHSFSSALLAAAGALLLAMIVSLRL